MQQNQNQTLVAFFFKEVLPCSSGMEIIFWNNHIWDKNTKEKDLYLHPVRKIIRYSLEAFWTRPEEIEYGWKIKDLYYFE